MGDFCGIQAVGVVSASQQHLPLEGDYPGGNRSCLAGACGTNSFGTGYSIAPFPSVVVDVGGLVESGPARLGHELCGLDFPHLCLRMCWDYLVETPKRQTFEVAEAAALMTHAAGLSTS